MHAMDTKYQEFDVQQKESIDDIKSLKAERNLSKYIVIGLVCVSLLVVVALAVGVGVGVTVSQSSSTAGEEDGLTVISLTQGELEGKYLSSGSGGGIHFRSTANATHYKLTISSSDGNLVVSILQPLALSFNMTLLGFSTANFLVMVGQSGHPRYDDYIVPDQMMEVMESIMRGNVEMSDSILQELDNSTVNETRETALRELALSREAQLIIEVALSLGEEGIIGIHFPSVMRFYQLALYLYQTRAFLIIDSGNSTLRYHNERESRSIKFAAGVNIPQSIVRNDIRQIKPEIRPLHESVRSQKRQSQCNNDIDLFPDGDDDMEEELQSGCNSCPYRRVDPVFTSDCFGMCGEECTCWWMVCGDCCANTYCESYRLCCAQAPMSSNCFSKVYFHLPEGATCNEVATSCDG